MVVLTIPELLGLMIGLDFIKEGNHLRRAADEIRFATGAEWSAYELRELLMVVIYSDPALASAYLQLKRESSPGAKLLTHFLREYHPQIRGLVEGMHLQHGPDEEPAPAEPPEELSIPQEGPVSMVEAEYVSPCCGACGWQKEGFCRRYPKVQLPGKKRGLFFWGHPMVDPGDFCGEYLGG